MSRGYVRRSSRRRQAGYVPDITALVLLFVLGDAPADRHRDVDTYYATEPFIGQMCARRLRRPPSVPAESR